MNYLLMNCMKQNKNFTFLIQMLEKKTKKVLNQQFYLDQKIFLLNKLIFDFDELDEEKTVGIYFDYLVDLKILKQIDKELKKVIIGIFYFFDGPNANSITLNSIKIIYNFIIYV